MLHLNTKSSSTIHSHFDIALLGDRGQGKTTLAAAITNVLFRRNGTDHPYSYSEICNPAETREDDVGIAFTKLICHTAADKGAYTVNTAFSLIDCASNADTVKKLLSSESHMAGAVLVIGTDRGPVPEAREQLRLAHQTGIPKVIVFLNVFGQSKSEPTFDMTETEVRLLLDDCGYRGDDTTIIIGNAREALKDPTGSAGDCIIELTNAMTAEVLGRRDLLKPFLMPITNVREEDGVLIVSGKLQRGVVRSGYKAEIVGIKNKYLAAVVSDILNGDMSNEARYTRYGSPVEIMLQGLQRGDVSAGQVLAAPGSIHAYMQFDAVVYILTAEEGGSESPFHDLKEMYFRIHTKDIFGVIRLPKGITACQPGKCAKMVITLQMPTAAENGTLFSIREAGRIIGMGVAVGLPVLSEKTDTAGSAKTPKPKPPVSDPDDEEMVDLPPYDAPEKAPPNKAQRKALTAEYRLTGEDLYREADRLLSGGYYEKGVAYLTRSAEKGYTEAQYWLACGYYYGKYGEKDLQKAAYWYKKAALQNDSVSQKLLSGCYLRGEGVKRNRKLASLWMKISKGKLMLKDCLSLLQDDE